MSLATGLLRCFLLLVTVFTIGCTVDSSEPSASLPVDCSQPVPSGKASYTGARDVSACSWKGIPYAAAPVGELRFQYARPPALTGAFDATQFGHTCLQATGFAVESYRTKQTFDEDCLNLNIWTPGGTADGRLPKGLPVMVWYYGGGFSQGSGATNLYNGEPLSRQGVVVVTLNYRVGALGWLGITGATDADGRALTGNYGLSDQIQALTWVKANIAAFGGDPQNVTIFGESAGAYSVCALMASPKADGLFQHAIMESGSCVMAGLDTHADYSRKWIAGVGCPVTAPASLACLRGLDPTWLEEHASWPLFEIDAPVVDGPFLPKQPLAAFRDGGRKVPLIAGFNHDEVKVLALANRHLLDKGTEPWDVTWSHIEAAVGVTAAAALHAAYPRDAYQNPRDMLLQAATDVLFSCPARTVAYTGPAPTYQYRFQIEPGSFFLEPLTGSFHASEIPFVWGNINLLMILFARDPSYDHAVTLSNQMVKYWTNFAKNGDPNSADLPAWTQFGKDENLMELATPLGASHGLFRERCEAWDAALPTELNTLVFVVGPKLIGTDSLF